ncbi:hypothetical protein V6N12_070966 [Hibiscus sabdariffa]|uniref:F-box domain-containing protein n=1 Tax=Hibiscus sabdariffa TaxID=183260 RepID=A0ABR2FIM0_9ROSI
MSLGRVYRSVSLNLKHEGYGEEESRLGFVRCTFGLGRKRVGISYETQDLTPLDSTTKVPLLKRQCSERMVLMLPADDYHEKSALESLPQDVLIRIICGVDHEDLKQLFNVSKSIREATVIAKQSYFSYSTPTKVKAFRTSIDFEGSNELDDIEAPNAPRQWRSHRNPGRFVMMFSRPPSDTSRRSGITPVCAPGRGSLHLNEPISVALPPSQSANPPQLSRRFIASKFQAPMA